MRRAVRGRGVTAAKAACTGRAPTQGCGGARARAERTKNIPCMVVTLDVSKVSVWLNAVAYCRVESQAHAVRGEGATAAKVACTRRA